MNKKQYLTPVIKMVAFKAEKGFAASSDGFNRAANDADFLSIFSGEAEEFNGKYNEQFDETDIDGLW